MGNQPSGIGFAALVERDWHCFQVNDNPKKQQQEAHQKVGEGADSAESGDLLPLVRRKDILLVRRQIKQVGDVGLCERRDVH